MTGFYEHGKEHSVSIKSVNFLTDDKKIAFFKNTGPWNYLTGCSFS
jgi:hypothetical protein